MDELARVLEACRREREAGRPVVLATVVSVSGSTYRRPGARMVFRAEGAPLGLISGGCLEEDLGERARTVLDSGRPRTIVYDMRSPDDIVWGLGLGCDGEVRVLLERLTAGDPRGYLEFIEECKLRRRPGVVATVFEVDGSPGPHVGDRLIFGDVGAGARDDGPFQGLRDRIERDAAEALERRQSSNAKCAVGGGSVRVLIEYVAPPVSLIVFGAGQDALPVVRLAKQLGWQVTVADHRPAYATVERFPQADAVLPIADGESIDAFPPIDGDTPILVMTHHFLHDLALLERLIPSPAPYVGVLGPRKRTEKLLDQLRERGVRPSGEQLARLHGPVGVDIGSETPEEIALSALAEIHAVLNGRRGGFLRESAGPLHEAP